MSDIVVVSSSDSEEEESSQRSEKIDAFMRRARDQFRMVVDAESDLRAKMHDDNEFRASNQWDEQAKAERDSDGRPCITVNRINQFVRQVTNAMRQAQLAVRVLAVDDGADVETAEVLQGMVRHIEQQSDAQVAYGTAAECQTSIGRGYWQIVREYETDDTFDQVLRIKRIRNPFSVFMDPPAQEVDGSDARFAFIVDDIPLEEYKSRFPKSSLTQGLETFSAVGLNEQDWMPEGKIRVANYFYIDEKPDELYHIRWESGYEDTITKQQYEQIPKEIIESVGMGHKPTILNKRPVRRRIVKEALINGVEILEGNEDLTEGREWPGKYIPIVQVLGDEIDLDGRIDLRGMVRDAKDPQRLYNYQLSTFAESLATVPRVPWIGYEGQFEGHESKWNTAHRRAWPYLEVRPVTIDGKPAPLPQRTSAGADVGAIVAAIQQSDQDLKATMGLYEPSLGIRQSSGQSGRAIQALQKQGEHANSNFLDNLGRSIRATGRILVDLIPKVYDAPRVVRILGEDNTESKAIVHAGQADSVPKQLPEGVKGVFDVSVGRYDVTVAVGPSIETKRREAYETLGTFINAYPNAFPLLGDLLVGNLDWPGASIAAERLKKALPPNLQAADNGSDQPIDPQQVMAMQAQMQQMAEALQQSQQMLQSKQMELQAKAQIESEKSQALFEIAKLKAETDLLKTESKIRAEQADQQIQVMLARLGHQAQAETTLNKTALQAALQQQQTSAAPPPLNPEEP